MAPVYWIFSEAFEFQKKHFQHDKHNQEICNFRELHIKVGWYMSL